MAETPDAHVEVDWAQADVSDGELTVGLTGDAPKEWAARFDAVAERLSRGGRWGAIKVKKKRITVAGVSEGAEGDLRHFLESVVQQVNADLEPEPEPESGDDGGEDDGASEEDRRMAETFRSFASGEDRGDPD
jgi:hypothetical protein